MNQNRWQQIDRLFEAVLEIPEPEREKFLAESCNGDDDLKNEVLDLLKIQIRTGNFLETSAMKIAAKHLADEVTVAFDVYSPGETVGTYKIEKLLGAGGMGEVYLAHDEKLQRKVALKILPPELISSDERVKRFQLEARAISILNHPNIVTIFDLGTAQNVNYIATEFVAGKNLRELIRSGVNIKDALNIIIQACEALSVTHSAGIIHRDIKPENIMLRPDNYIKILDFGLAKLSESNPFTPNDFAKTAKGVIIGTPAYMSPEQVSGDLVDYRTDLWSLGVVLYELLTGVNPFKKENRRTTLQAVLTEKPPPPSSLNAKIPPQLDQILLKVLEKDSDLSYQTASDLRADLRRVRREIDSSLTWSSDWQGNKKTAFRRTYLFYASIFSFLFLIGFGVWSFTDKSKLPFIRETPEWVKAQHSQLTSSHWIEGFPSLSPDGKNIIFVSTVEGDSNIYLQRVGGKTQNNLTPNSKERDTMPAFSTDGKFIAFRSDRTPSGIYVMEETGENARRISDIGFHPAWSPDNKKIVVSDRYASVHTGHTVPNSSLLTIDVASGEKQKLETGGDAIMPNWSPNGHRIAFWFVANGNPGEIATIPADGGEPIIVASDAAADWNPVWSPDGKYLYFASSRAGNMSLWRVAIDEKTGRELGEPELVPTTSKYCRHITFSRDGKLISYIRYESKSNLQTISFDPKTLKTNGEAQWLTRGNIEISNPQLSPDGELFLVRHPNNTQEDLAVFDKNGGSWRNLTNDRFQERNPRWSPDGKRIAFQSDRSGKFQIWMVDADGSNSEQVTFTEKSAAVSPVISPDGTRMIFAEDNGNLRKPLMLDLSKPWAKQTPQLLPPFPDLNVSYWVRDWSKDGKKLLVVFSETNSDENGIAVFDFSTSEYEKIIDIGAFPTWLNDNRHFIFTHQNTVYLCDTNTKKVTELYKPSAYELQHANVSPGNRMIFFRYLQVEADVWLIDVSQLN